MQHRNKTAVVVTREYKSIGVGYVRLVRLYIALVSEDEDGPVIPSRFSRNNGPWVRICDNKRAPCRMRKHNAFLGELAARHNAGEMPWDVVTDAIGAKYPWNNDMSLM